MLKTAKRLEDQVTQLAQRLDSRGVSDPDVDCGLALIEEVHAYLEQIDSDDSSHCVAVFGTAGVGKSTVSLLFGRGELRVHHETQFSQVLVADDPIPGVKIRSGCVSKTLLPGVVHTQINGEPAVVFDMPGRQDTRGPFALHYHVVACKAQEFAFVAGCNIAARSTALANAINGACGSNGAVLLYTKCDIFFNPEFTQTVEGVDPTCCLCTGQAFSEIKYFGLLCHSSAVDCGCCCNTSNGQKRTATAYTLAGSQPNIEMFQRHGSRNSLGS